MRIFYDPCSFDLLNHDLLCKSTVLESKEHRSDGSHLLNLNHVVAIKHPGIDHITRTDNTCEHRPPPKGQTWARSCFYCKSVTSHTLYLRAKYGCLPMTLATL